MKKTGVNKTNRWQRVLISAAIMISAIGPFAAVAQNLWLITFDIGHANSELFVFPDGKTMLFDTGTETACRDKIIPFLQYHGINQINYVIRSHEHADHVGGVKPLTDGGFINGSTLVQNCKSFKIGDRFNRSGTAWYIYNASRGGMENIDSVSFFMNYNGFRISGSGDEKGISKEDFLAKRNGNEGINHSEFLPTHVRIYNEHATGNITYAFESQLNAYIWIFPTYEGNPNIQQAHKDVARNSPRFQKIVYMDKIHVIRASSGTEWESFFLSSISARGKFLTGANNASYVSQTVPTTMVAGQTASVTVRMKNTGTSTWSPTDAQKLGSLNDSMTWGVNRIYLTNSVAPGKTNAFTFNITAPATAGTYSFQWRMVDDAGSNIGWFGANSALQTITVSSGASTTVPWVTNLTVAAAGTAITNAGLVVGSVSQEYHATVPAGRIFSQTPGGGTTVNRGSSVALAESLGPASGGTTVTFTSVGAYDGYVDEASETSNTGGVSQATMTDGNAIRVGDTGAKKQRKGFVSFDCSSLPDTCTITAATLKLKRGGGIGTPTTLGTITVDVKNVNTGWSDNVALQITDFQGPASASSVATLSYPATTNAWATGSLNATGLAKINKTTASHTQYRIRFTTDDDNDTADDFLGFYSGENATAANRPILEVTYQ